MSENSIDEGVIKFKIHWQEEGPVDWTTEIQELNEVRNRMFEQRLIGFDEKHQVGYGNLSVRTEPEELFVISGTQTGHLETLGPEHYSRILKYDIEGNELWCAGPLKASSESLTHAAIYDCDPGIGAVLHIHNASVWKGLMDKVPTSGREVPYGTPEMAEEIFRLWKNGELQAKPVMVMSGHDDGVIAFGKDILEAESILMEFSRPFLKED